MGTTTARRFPFFDEVEAPPGAEGWDRMYPNYLVPDSEDTNVDERLWFADTMHWSKVVYPFDSLTVDAVFLSAGQYSSRVFAIPPAMGLDARIVNGFAYLSPTPVTDPEEIARRAEHFQERAGYYYENWDSLYERWKEKARSVIDNMAAIEFPQLGELDPIEVVIEARGRSTCWDFVESYRRLIDQFFLIWQYHFEMLNLGYGAYVTFFDFCKGAFPAIADQSISRMVAGIEVIAFRPDDELRGLAKLAMELGIEEDLLGDVGDPAGTLAAIAGRPEGGRWLEALESAKDPWFNYSTGYGFYHDEGSWIDDLSVPLEGVARYIRQLLDGEAIERPLERLRQERDELVDEYRALLSAEEVAQFDQLLGLSRTVFPFIEEHNFYVEHWAHTVFWSKMREFATALVEAGMLEDAEDAYYLNRFELDIAAFDVAESWAIGVAPRGARRWRREVSRRREIVEALRSAPPAPAFGVPPEEVTDPFAIMNYGVTTERIEEWLGDGKDKAGGIGGIPGSPGVAEGPVRVIRSETELREVQPGEILVAPITAPAWASVFSVVAGVVTDIGGMMSHAAIVCREFGTPAVVGTGDASQRLTSGQQVRIDGNAGTVTVVE